MTTDHFTPEQKKVLDTHFKGVYQTLEAQANAMSESGRILMKCITEQTTLLCALIDFLVKKKIIVPQEFQEYYREATATGALGELLKEIKGQPPDNTQKQ